MQTGKECILQHFVLATAKYFLFENAPERFAVIEIETGRNRLTLLIDRISHHHLIDLHSAVHLCKHCSVRK